jgi:cell wall hydrolase
MISKDELMLLKWTVFLEAEGEPFEGKIAVAYVIRNRASAWQQSIYQVCWQKWQFSCWNEDERIRRIKRLENADVSLMKDCEAAAEAAAIGAWPDPTHGATHYLNEPLTRKIRGDGTLPEWVAKMTHTAKIGQHDFYK